MLPIVGLFVIIQPALFCIALGGGLALGSIVYWAHRYYLNYHDKKINHWYLPVYVFILFIIIIIFYRLTIGSDVIEFELIKSMSYAR